MNYYSFGKKTCLSIIIALISFFTWQSVLAVWTDPDTSPPGDNIPAPLNITSSDQSKTGRLSVGGAGLNYWIAKNGDSFTLTNSAEQTKFVVGQDGNVAIGTTGSGNALRVYGPKGVMAEDESGYAYFSGKKNANLTQNAYFDGSWKSYGSAASYGSAIVLQTDGAAGTALSVFADDSVSAADEDLFFSKLLTVKTSGNVGIGTINPGARLDVNGTIKISGGAPGDGKVLTSDAAGLAAWETPATGGIAGSGTVNQLSKFTATDSIGNSLIFDNGTNIGIGTATPGAKLDVNGTIKISGGAPGAGKVLTSDAAGLASWTTPAAGTIDGSGTANYVSKFTDANTLGSSLIYDNGTNIGIGSTSPAAKLDVAGTIKISGGTPGAGKVLTSDAAGLASWTTPASSGVTGSGTSNYVAKFTSSSAVGNSKIYDNGTSVGIGTANPQATLDVRGSLGVYGTLGATGVTYLQGGSQVTGNETVSGSVTAASFYYSSDAALKKNISPIANSIDKINQLNGVYFNWIDSGNPSMGLIAQDVEKIFPEAVSANPQTGFKTVDYGKMVAPLIEAVKEQQKQIETLKKEVDELKSQNGKTE